MSRDLVLDFSAIDAGRQRGKPAGICGAAETALAGRAAVTSAVDRKSA
jgi:hypothetical protein